MISYEYVAVYETNLIRSSETSLAANLAMMEIFDGPRTLQTAFKFPKVFAREIQDVPFRASVPLPLPRGRFISVSAYSILPDTKQPDQQAEMQCELTIDSAVTQLSVLLGPGVFMNVIYRGWLLRSGQMVARTAVLVADPVELPPGLASTLVSMQHALSSRGPSSSVRFRLMARFFAKSLPWPPSEEKFLLLWTVLEIFPMERTSNIRPLQDYLGAHMQLDPADVKTKLELGRLYGHRCDLVHNGEIDFPTLMRVIGKLEAICLEVFRSICGLPYAGSLDKHLAAPAVART